VHHDRSIKKRIVQTPRLIALVAAIGSTTPSA
jgi:hypothetical protein